MPEGWLGRQDALAERRKTGERLLRSLPGVTIQEERYGRWRNRQRLIRMTVDLDEASWDPELHIPKPFPSLETLTEQVKRRPATEAAVNAAFFHPDGHPASVLIHGREIVSFGRHSPGPNGYNHERQAFGYIGNTGRAQVAPFAFHFRLDGPNGEWHGSAVNRPVRGKREATLVTPPYQPDMFLPDGEPLQGSCTIIRLTDAGSQLRTDETRDGTARAMLDEEATAPLKAGTFMLYLPDRESEPPSGEVALTVGVGAPWKEASFLIGGGPMFDLTDGRVKLTMNPRSPAARLRAPRTAVMVRRGGRLMEVVVVDGRHRHGKGVSLPDLWQYARTIGAEAAMNLDGGGSSGMVLRDRDTRAIRLANVPADGAERRVSASLHLTEKQIEPATEKGVENT